MSSKNHAADRRQEIIAENINFMYGRSKENAAYDLDKRSFVKSNKFIDPFDTISDFKGDHAFLLPSFECPVFLSGDTESYPSYEHALQASRFSLLEERCLIRETPLIRDVKKMTSRFDSNRGEKWKQECMNIAEQLLRDKFIRSKEMTSKLKATGKKSLVYANTYGELYWGTSVEDRHKGQNRLGKLLEKIRSDIVKGEDIDLWLSNSLKIIEQEKVEINILVEKNGEKFGDNQLIERRPKIFIGKADLNDVVTAHNSTSRSHAVIVIGTLSNHTGLQSLIVDLRSANGTFINSKKISPYIFTPITADSHMVFGASTRSYRFLVDLERHKRIRESLYDKLANPDILVPSSTVNDENTTFVGNISFDATEKDVQEFFSSCGTIQNVFMPKDKEDKSKHRGIAFVTFTSMSGLTQALSRGGDELMGRNISVKRKEVKPSADKRTADPKVSSYYVDSSGTKIGDYIPGQENIQRDEIVKKILATSKKDESGIDEDPSRTERPNSRFSSSSSSSSNNLNRELPSEKNALTGSETDHKRDDSPHKRGDSDRRQRNDNVYERENDRNDSRRRYEGRGERSISGDRNKRKRSESPRRRRDRSPYRYRDKGEDRRDHRKSSGRSRDESGDRRGKSSDNSRHESRRSKDKDLGRGGGERTREKSRDRNDMRKSRSSERKKHDRDDRNTGRKTNEGEKKSESGSSSSSSSSSSDKSSSDSE